MICTIEVWQDFDDTENPWRARVLDANGIPLECERCCGTGRDPSNESKECSECADYNGVEIFKSDMACFVIGDAAFAAAAYVETKLPDNPFPFEIQVIEREEEN